MRSSAGMLRAFAIAAAAASIGVARVGTAQEHFDVVPIPGFTGVDKSEMGSNSILLCSHQTFADLPEPASSEQGKPLCADDCAAALDKENAPGCADECGAPTKDNPLCCCAPARSPWYVSVSGAWEQRETVHEIDDARTFIKFHGGFLANAAIGVRCDCFRLEFETSFMNNGVELAGAGGLSSPAVGNVNLHAYMFNAYHDVEIKNCCWKPYVGAGIGVYQSELNGLNPEFFDQLGAPFTGQPINATSDMPLAYQFRAGLTRPLGCRAELYSGYRYFRGEELEFASAPFAAFAPTFHPDAAKVHAIELGVRVNF